MDTQNWPNSNWPKSNRPKSSILLLSPCVLAGNKKTLVFPRPNTHVTSVFDVSFGSRAVPIGRKRARRACIRSGRIRCFAKKNQRACRLLFKGGALPQSTCGQQIRCIPPTAMKRLRAAAAWTSGGYRAGLCTTTLLSITKTEATSRLLSCVLARPPIVEQEK